MVIVFLFPPVGALLTEVVLRQERERAQERAQEREQERAGDALLCRRTEILRQSIFSMVL